MGDNLDPSEEGSIHFFVDGQMTSQTENQNCISKQPIGFIGNSSDGSSPFGTVSDVRIYPYTLKRNQIEMLSNYHEDLEFDMPDKYLTAFVE